MTTDQHNRRVVAERYELHGQLGRGGMGIVWRALDMQLGREVAVKEVLFPEELSEQERAEAQARTFREARAAARITHPHAVTVHDILEADGRPWIVMELIDGVSLRDEIKRRDGLPAAEVAKIAGNLLEALAHAHAKGVVHRDVKPANVLLSGGRVVLTDFGIATIEGDTTLTGSGALVGTPEYVSPERLGSAPTAAPPADLWGLGVTLYTALEGESPFHRDTVAAVINAVLRTDPPPPAHAGFLTPLLHGLLARDPDARLTAPQALNLLDALQGGNGGNAGTGGDRGSAPAGLARGVSAATAPVPVPWPRTRLERTLTGHPRVYAGVTGALALALIAAATWIATRPPETEYEVFATDAYSVEYPPEWTWEQTPDTETRTFSHPDSRTDMSFSTYAWDSDFGDPKTVLAEWSEDKQGDDEDDWEDFQQVRLETVDAGHLPGHWSAAELEYTHTVSGDDAENPERHGLNRVIFAESDDDFSSNSFGPAYEIDWVVPEDRYDEFADVREHVLFSFRPHE